MYLCITPDREIKTRMIMEALAHGMPEAKIVIGEPPDDMEPFVIWGQMWLTLKVLPKAIRQGRKFWHVDNGYVFPAKGGSSGYYRITYNGMSPVLLPRIDEKRINRVNIKISPWQKTGKQILIAMPGMHYGHALGMNMQAWCDTIVQKVKARTSRQICIRTKKTARPMSDDLKNAWAVVTHSSNFSVDAVVAGVPVFVAPTSPASPVGRVDDFDFEHPVYPDREKWLASLLMQQYTLSEMHSGYAYTNMKKVLECLAF